MSTQTSYGTSAGAAAPKWERPFEALYGCLGWRWSVHVQLCRVQAIPGVEHSRFWFAVRVQV
jgi:hypothetical protein